MPRMGKGDWLPFGIIGLAMVLAVLFPLAMMIVAFAWWLFVTIRLALNAKPSMTWRQSWTLWTAFSVPVVLVLGAAVVGTYA